MKSKYVIPISLVGLLLCIDQLSKTLVRSQLGLGEETSVLGSFISLAHSRNTGLIFSSLAEIPDPLKGVFFIGIPLLALILIVLIFLKLNDQQWFTTAALATILAGAVGNLLDRAQLGYVVNIFGSSLLPERGFNVADVSIVVGMVFLLIGSLRHFTRGNAA